MISQDWDSIKQALDRGEPTVLETDSGTTMRIVPAPAPGISLVVEETDAEGTLVSRTRFYDSVTERPVEYPSSVPFLPGLPVTAIARRGPPAMAICMFGMTVHGTTVLDPETCPGHAAELVRQSEAEGWHAEPDPGKEPGQAITRWSLEKGTAKRSILAMTVPKTALIMFDEPGL